MRIYLHIYLKACIIWCIMIGTSQSVLSDPTYYFKQLSLNEGLSQSTVKCALSDHKGLIWIGTRFGLNCFDRKQMKSYYYEDNDPNSISNNEIDFIIEDAKQNLWIGTLQNLVLYNRKEDNFIRMSCDSVQVEAHAAVLIEDGVLFFGRGKFYKFTYTSNKLEALPLILNSTSPILVDKARMFDAEKGLLLLTCRWHGAWWYNFHTGKVCRVPFVPDNEIAAVHVDSLQQIWISPYGKGVSCYNKEGKLLLQLSTTNHLTNDIVLDINEKDSEIWCATDGGGITVYDVKTNQSRVIEHNPGDPYSCPINSFICLYNDRENNTWAGSIRGGLIGIKEVYIKTYQDVTLNSKHGLSNKTVVGMHEDKDGILWFGTDGGGINRFDPATKIFRHYPSTYSYKVVSIIGHTKEELIISIFGQGLYYFNKQSGALKEIMTGDKTKHEQMFRAGKSVHLMRFTQDEICLLADSLYIYNLSDRHLEAIPGIEPDIEVSSLHFVTSNEYVSYFKSSSSILEFNHKLKHIRTFYKLDESLGVIATVARNKNGNFWIGTTTGLFSYNPYTQEVKRIHSDHFVGVSAVCFDQQNRMWIGTHNALYTYEPSTGKFILFGESDGVSANEYIFKAPLISRVGDIYMAGVMGLVCIDAHIPFPENPDPDPILVNVMLDGALMGNDVADSDLFSIPWDHTSLTFRVIVKENDLMRKKLFRYYLEGDRNEVIESYDQSITYHSLPVGKYNLLVSCNKKNGEWSQPTKVASLVVMPPWWQTRTFLLLVILFTCVVIAAVIYLLLKRKESKMRWAMKEHEQKTYEDKIRFLINISHELRTPLTLIYAPLKRMLNSGEVKEENLVNQLSDIFKQTRRIKNIINMVLDVRKMEVGGDSLNIQSHDLNSWICSIADDFRNECHVRQIQLNYDLDETVKAVPFDPLKCEVIMSNLLMNALKFSESNTTITVSTRLLSDSVKVSVSDQGIGLNNVDMSKLFSRFYQGEHDRKGSGIGLSYSQLLVEMHGGKIGATANEGPGATFFYELPLQNKAGVVVAQPYLNELLSSPEKETYEVSDYNMQKFSILLVDDEPELRNYLKDALASCFKRVYVANDGLEALEMTARYLPDIVVSDVMMPRMDGFELCQHIKSNLEISHIPVVLLTARTDTESTRQGYKLGADVYLPKPFDLDFLLTVIRSQLKNRETVKVRYKDNISIVVPKEDTISNADEKFMQKLNTLILENIGNSDLDVNFVAEQMAMSRASLYNKMKALTDVSIGDYINKFRMTRASELLANKDLSILDVSEKVGFTSQRYFSTAFKQTFGVSPSAYRQENKGA